MHVHARTQHKADLMVILSSEARKKNSHSAEEGGELGFLCLLLCCMCASFD